MRYNQAKGVFLIGWGILASIFQMGCIPLLKSRPPHVVTWIEDAQQTCGLDIGITEEELVNRRGAATEIQEAGGYKILRYKTDFGSTGKTSSAFFPTTGNEYSFSSQMAHFGLTDYFIKNARVDHCLCSEQ